RGYFVVRGGPGQGKTAVACHLVKTLGLVHHFVGRTGGRADVRLILRSLLAQLPVPARAEPRIPEALPALTKALEDALARLVARQGGLILVLDALDELPEESVSELPFLVGDSLPKGVYVVVTSRPGERLDRLLAGLFAVPQEVHDLGTLGLPEM